VPIGQAGLSFRYAETFGVTGEGYPADTDHVNGPQGLFIDTADNLFVSESRGYRVLEYDPSGANLLTLGEAGLCYTDDYVLCAPYDQITDGSGNIWVADGNRIVEYDSIGTFVQQLPTVDAWEAGDDDTHFNAVFGIAADAVGRLFVSDSGNHRVQVYTFSGGAPVYDGTIGVTGIAANDNGHLDTPHKLAVDSGSRVYVVDTGNDRVQRCEYNASTWSCMTFAGGLNAPRGIALDGGDNVYIADSDNARIRKCDPFASCSDLITGLPGFIADVAVDSGGNIYLADANRHIVTEHDPTGTPLGTFIGTTTTPYVPDSTRLNSPWGIAIAADGSLYVAEHAGYRLVKMDSSGTQLWTVGNAGVWGSADDELGNWWAGPQGNLAIDGSGNVFVADTGNQRVQIFDSSGTLVGTFGSYGAGNYQFDCPAGVAINPANGDIFVVDRCNQRVQVFNSSRVYKATIGTTGEIGTDNAHLNWPWGVAVDSAGNIYVADTENDRLLKCTLSGANGVCSTFVGEVDVVDTDFGHLHPFSVATDASGRVYVADDWNVRVLVYDSSGAYLTSVGGSWGPNSGEMRWPAGVATDNDGNLYVTDGTSHRVQKFSQGVPAWTQSNVNGFGDPDNALALSLSPFGGRLYAGTANISGSGAQLWRLGPSGWASVMTDGFGNDANGGIDHLLQFNGQLYAGTWADETNGGEVWRSSDGSVWTQVVSSGFGDPTNAEVFRFAEFGGSLYASTWSYTETHGSEIWRSSTGDGGDWSRVLGDEFGDSNNTGVLGLDAFDGYLYAGTSNSSTGAEVWRTANGTDWTQVNADGFGAGNWAVMSFAGLGGSLYAGTGNGTTGGQIWRCQVCDGSDWAQIVGDGIGDSNNSRVEGLIPFGGRIFAITLNRTTGMEVWSSADGTTWAQANPDGFGDGNNLGPYWDNSATVFDGNLFIGTWNYGNGTEVWQMLEEAELQHIYLPLIMR